mgnify:CR=1 FL=1
MAGNRRIVCGCGPFPEHAPGNDYWFFRVLLVLVASIVVDIITALLDPRIKLS